MTEKMSAPTPPPQWFRRALAEGLTRLVALSLPGTPPAETIKLTREAWVESLWDGRAWDETDAERIAAAFRAIARRADRWPAPRHLVEHLPARPAPRALPKPKPNAEQREKVRAQIDKLNKKLRRWE